MKKHVTILVAVIILIASAFLSVKPAFAIISGDIDGNGHPYVGALDLRPAGMPPVPCTGILISPTVFLTAGHCTTFLDQAGLDTARVTFEPVFSDNARFYTGSVHTNPLYIPFYSGGQSDPGDFGIIVFSESVIGITPASLPTANLLDQIGPRGLKNQDFPTAGYGVTKLLSSSAPGGFPDVDWDSGGTRMVATDTFSSLTNSWLRLSMNNSGRDCIGDSGAPKFLGNSNLVVAIGVGGDVVCKSMVAGLRLDTSTARTFLGQFVNLP